MASKTNKMRRPHVLAIPYPAHSHIISLMDFSLCLIENGVRVTYVNTEFNHPFIVNALKGADMGDQLRLVSIPDGIDSHDDKAKPWKATEAIRELMPRKLDELIRQMNGVGEDEITCVVADKGIGWAMEVAARAGIPRAAFCPTAGLVLALGFSIPKLVKDDIIDKDGSPIKNQMIQLSPSFPAVHPRNLFWVRIGDLNVQKMAVKAIMESSEAIELADWVICNSVYDLEPVTFDFVPKMLPIGPVAAMKGFGISARSFLSEDPTCLKWLDQQPPRSVIYAAFGTITTLSQNQFQELAIGLEFCNMPFLWVVRPVDGISYAYPDGLEDRVGSRGKIVDWAHQQSVLSHPSVACVFSHCGWNSIMEGVTNGLPFLCWPHFGDQFLDESYLCDVWKIGLRLNPDENGMITRGEIRKKVKQLVADEKIKATASNLKKVVIDSVSEGGSSYNSLQNFIKWVKA